ncbi:MAG TPA: hypothetical protein VGQ81_06865 [Acidobacteriota bacterium]|jgi:hypothetical protein|nr:hypothetical protein [Acidobacteriota bacterium]
MRHILEFIVQRSLDGRTGEIKEYTIATEVLGRRPDFDPRNDNIVRVQVHRLRKKLEEYYNSEGAHDPFRIFIPRGRYYPDYVRLPSPEQTLDTAPAVPTASVAARTAQTWLSITWPGVAVALLVVDLALSIYLLVRPATGTNAAMEQIAETSSLASLWQPFIQPGQPPLVVYSNALFLMSEHGDLFRYYTDTSHSLAMGARVPSLAGLERRGPHPGHTGPLYYFDSYTGIGEVVAMGRIAKLLSKFGQDFLVKRSRITSYEDIRNRNVIFLGASLEDSILGRLPVESDLVFEEPQGEFVGRLLIRDRRALAGAPTSYEFRRDDRTKALQGEYALISLLPGVTPNQRILILAGLSTLGTQAAAEFAASEDSMSTLERARGGLANARQSPYFQALLDVQVRDGIAVKTSCLFVRPLHRN